MRALEIRILLHEIAKLVRDVAGLFLSFLARFDRFLRPVFLFHFLAFLASLRAPGGGGRGGNVDDPGACSSGAATAE